MSEQLAKVNITLVPNDNARLANLCGPFDEHLHQIEKRLAVEIHHRGNAFTIEGEEQTANAALAVLKNLFIKIIKSEKIKQTDMKSKAKILKTIINAIPLAE